LTAAFPPIISSIGDNLVEVVEAPKPKENWLTGLDTWCGDLVGGGMEDASGKVQKWSDNMLPLLFIYWNHLLDYLPARTSSVSVSGQDLEGRY
jgi:hypothetical protein